MKLNMYKNSDIYTVLGILIAVALAIFSPNMPKISSTIGFITGIVIFVIVFLLVLLLNFYLNERRKRNVLEIKIEKITKQIEENKKDLFFLKERFKTLEDFAETKVKLDIIEKKVLKR
jgi:divalent metal cation (Fe/Co/Zn/Cd) transporter